MVKKDKSHHKGKTFEKYIEEDKYKVIIFCDDTERNFEGVSENFKLIYVKNKRGLTKFEMNQIRKCLENN